MIIINNIKIRRLINSFILSIFLLVQCILHNISNTVCSTSTSSIAILSGKWPNAASVSSCLGIGMSNQEGNGYSDRRHTRPFWRRRHAAFWCDHQAQCSSCNNNCRFDHHFKCWIHQIDTYPFLLLPFSGFHYNTPSFLWA